MLKLAAFADEIAPDLDTQIDHCRQNGVTHFELRSVNGINVLDFDPPLRREIKRKLAANGLGVMGIGSPIGKVPLSAPFAPHFERFKIAVEIAEFFEAPLIRIFSYYESFPAGRSEVLQRMHGKIAYLEGRQPILVHENEGGIYGETGAACRDLLESIESPRLRCAFDPANFIIAGEDPRANWKLLKPYTVHMHIKDARAADRTIVPAGQGDGHIGEILKDAYASGYRGFLSLEPHLSIAGQFTGFTGPALFKTAADALKQVARDNGVPIQTPAPV